MEVWTLPGVKCDRIYEPSVADRVKSKVNLRAYSSNTGLNKFIAKITEKKFIDF